MRAAKRLAIGLIAGMVGVCLVGGASAIAESTALCKEDVKVCPKGSLIEHIHGTTIGKATLLSSVLNIECDILSLGDVEGSALGSPLVFHGVNTYTNCNNGCTITQITPEGIIEVLKTGHETAQITGESELNVHCGFLINCTYNGEGLEGSGLGPLLSSQKNGDISGSEQELNRVSGFCPEHAKADGSATALEPIYVTN